MSRVYTAQNSTLSLFLGVHALHTLHKSQNWIQNLKIFNLPKNCSNNTQMIYTVYMQDGIGSPGSVKLGINQ